jgi:ribosomal protein S18 acetylase RimI-like enzyme
VWYLGFTIRQAVSQDSEELITLSEELIHLDDWAARKAMLFTALTDPASTIFVAEADDTLVGFIEVRVFPDFVEGSLIAIIQNLVVKTDYRRRGVGNQLLQRVMDEVETRHATETHVWTEFDNQPAITLYTQHGFLRRGLLLERESERHIC